MTFEGENAEKLMAFIYLLLFVNIGIICYFDLIW